MTGTAAFRLAQSVRDRFGRCVQARHRILVEAYH